MIKKVLFSLLIIILMLTSIEVGLQTINSIIHLAKPKKNTVEEATILFQEIETAQKQQYEPFIEWRGKEYHGQYVNVDALGVRKTWNPEHFLGKEPKSIYMFGGSTLWGYGARDDHTIPSHLSKLLNQKDPQFIVHNFGEHAYIFTQEIIRLILLLKGGKRPDFVIFYDGVNEVYSAYQAGMAGMVQGLSDIKEKLSKAELTNMEHIRIGMKGFIQNHSMIYRAISKITNSGPHQETALQYNGERLKKLTNDIVSDYVQSLKLVEHLSKAFGFQYICLWQPGLPPEGNGLDEDELAKMYADVGDSITQRSIPHFFNIAKELEDKMEPYYFDWTHLTEEGNEIVAEKIYEILVTHRPLF